MKEEIELELERYIMQSDSSFFVVQIGANDGKMADPIHNQVKAHGWSGVFVEPVTYLFDRLKQNYRGFGTNLRFENSAVTSHTGEVDFYQFPSELESDHEFPYWASGMGSVLKPFGSPGHATLKNKNFKMVKQKTPCITFSDLVIKYDISKIDLLQIDVEGYDGTLLMNMDFSKIKPKFIRYEDKHIDTVLRDGLTKVSSKDVVEYLQSVGYEVGNRTNGFDRICCLR